MKIVLPTAEIVREFRGYEPIFCFYEDGIKGIVRDSVLLSTGLPDWDALEDRPSDQPCEVEAFIERVVADYENSIERRFLENTYPKNSPSIMMEMVIAQITYAVNAMMRALFMLRAYEICKSRYTWVGDDLIASIQVLDNPYDSH